MAEVVGGVLQEQGKLRRRVVGDADLCVAHELGQEGRVFPDFWACDADGGTAGQSGEDLYDGKVEADGRLMEEFVRRIEAEVVMQSAEHLLRVGPSQRNPFGRSCTPLVMDMLVRLLMILQRGTY